MLENIPSEILYFIFNITIHPYNNYYYIMKLIYLKINKFKILDLIKNKKMICYYCDLVFDKKELIKDGGYCSSEKKPICKLHFFNCRLCKKIHDFYQHSFIRDCCLICK